MQWRKANESDFTGIGNKHWRDFETKMPIPSSLAYSTFKIYGHPVEVLDESTPYPILKKVNDLLGLTGCASLEEVGSKFESMRRKVEETSTVHGKNVY